jgi:hypothetical protein
LDGDAALSQACNGNYCAENGAVEKYAPVRAVPQMPQCDDEKGKAHAVSPENR